MVAETCLEKCLIPKHSFYSVPMSLQSLFLLNYFEIKVCSTFTKEIILVYITYRIWVQWRSQGGKGSRVPPLTAKNLPEIGKKRGKSEKREEKSGRKDKNREGSFTFPLLTDRAGYATVWVPFLSNDILKLVT